MRGSRPGSWAQIIRMRRRFRVIGRSCRRIENSDDLPRDSDRVVITLREAAALLTALAQNSAIACEEVVHHRGERVWGRRYDRQIAAEIRREPGAVAVAD